MNWRTEIKNFFSERVGVAMGDSVYHWGGWNSHKDNTSIEETLPELSIFFEYSTIGDGLAYLEQTNIKTLEAVPVQVTLHILFNAYTDANQDCAYAYAHNLNCFLSGEKHELIRGQIRSVQEIEDIRHTAQYHYQIVFGFEVLAAVFLPTSEELVDANPVDAGGNPNTGRRLNQEIRIDLPPKD